MTDHPLVSCIMPTADRRRFVPHAIHYFQAQDYRNRELIVLDDGQDAVADLMPDDPRVRYVRLDRRHALGAKRNLACEAARGELIAHWDDDDWHAPHRLSYQVGALLRADAQVCGTQALLFYDAANAKAWEYRYPPGHRFWLAGGTLCYRRAFWRNHPFPAVDVGEDARFVWSGPAAQMIALPDHCFYVAMIHPHNVSPKQTHSRYYKPYSVERIRDLLGREMHQPSPEVPIRPRVSFPAEAKPTVKPIRNVFACLVHEKQECVIDLVRNLRHLDPESEILLYNGGNNPTLLNHGFPFERFGATIHPTPRPQAWGLLHHFAFDSMRFAVEHFDFDTLTIVDSDQLSIRPHYSRYLARHLADRPQVGLLGNNPKRQPSHTQVGPAKAAFQELALWQPFLRRFPNGESRFAHWSFWPSTVFTADATRALLKLLATDRELQDILARSRIWATEEVILPTLVALLGFQVDANPCSYDLVKYRTPFTTRQIDQAQVRQDVFWVHPVPRQYNNALRQHIRTLFNHYQPVPPIGGQMNQSEQTRPNGLPLTLPILSQMKQVEGWLEEDEADALIAAATQALTTLPLTPAVIEIGSYCGRSTVVLGSVAQRIPGAKVHAIDPHDGQVGALDQGIQTGPPTLHKFKQNIARANLEGVVELIQALSFEVAWDKPIAMLLIDGLHDYANVARDFYHFDAHVAPGGYVAFHDYADYYPGVKALVHEVLAAGNYHQVQCVRSLMVIQKQNP